MMTAKHEITRDDVIPMARYAEERQARRRVLVDMKRHRRLALGPDCTFYFENFETMWNQVHEMLFIEKGGEAQIEDEPSADNPLVPKGRELIATVMFEIDEPTRRAALLAKLGGETIRGVPEADVERTSAQGKASSVQFIHFPFTDAQVAKFRVPGTEVVAGFTHPEYGHMAALPEAVRQALAEDFD